METVKPRYAFAKRIFGALGLYVSGKTGAMRSKYIHIRNFLRFFGLYPNMRMMHFYYEGPNSFMAPKIYEYIQMLKGVKLKKSDVILDVGCGDGTLSVSLGKSVKKVVGIDVDCEMIENARYKAKELSPKVNGEFHCQKLETLGFEHESFDKVFSFSVIEHIPNYMEVFEEIYSLLKKDGEFILSIDSFSDFDPEMRKVHQSTFEVQRYFEKDELYELLENLGFKDIQITPIFKSKFAAKWFTRVMNNPREYFAVFKRFYSFFLYYKIKYHEKQVKQDDRGIFLLAKCRK